MTVVHLKRDEYDVRIDRKTRWGNPFYLSKESERAEVINKYRVYLKDQIKIGNVTLEELAALHGKRLGCWCSPKPCHGDVLLKASEWAFNKLEKT